MMKGCELCPGTARMFCESDQASLCFECDAKVHSANFLVARHSRVLLCRSCQAPTPWMAAGPRLCPTVSICDSCFGGRSKKNGDDDDEGESVAREGIAEEEEGGANEDDRQEEDVEDEEMEGEDDDDDEMESDDDDDEEEEEEEGEEQVVPWSTEPPPPPVASSSSSEEESTGGQRFGNQLKRNRWENVDLPSSSSSRDQLPCSSPSRPTHLPNRAALSNLAVRAMADDNETTSYSFRPSKDRKKSGLVRSGSHQLSAISFGSGRPPI